MPGRAVVDAPGDAAELAAADAAGAGVPATWVSTNSSRTVFCGSTAKETGRLGRFVSSAWYGPAPIVAMKPPETFDTVVVLPPFQLIRTWTPGTGRPDWSTIRPWMV
ncbi:MAG TPA: hypothetical protein VF170_14785, partial [Planctomycetaceae bacterium]